MWTKLSEECFQHLIESMSHIFEAALKAGEGPSLPYHNVLKYRGLWVYLFWMNHINGRMSFFFPAPEVISRSYQRSPSPLMDALLLTMCAACLLWAPGWPSMDYEQILQTQTQQERGNISHHSELITCITVLQLTCTGGQNPPGNNNTLVKFKMMERKSQWAGLILSIHI